MDLFAGCIAVLCLSLYSICEAGSYDGYNTISAGPLRSSDDVSLINSLVDENDSLNQVILLSEVVSVSGNALLLVAPARVQSVLDSLATAGIPHQTQDADHELQLSESRASNRMAKTSWSRRRSSTAPDYYMTGEQINEWMSDMAKMYSSFVTMTTMGHSWEGRPLSGLVIDETGGPNARHVLLHGGLHAREWLTHATVIYIMHELITATRGDGKRMRQKYVWHLFPNVNPDGYHVTHTTDRYWRKNRRINDNTDCIGVDLCRNWDTDFGETGASPNPCSNIYHGPSAFSEPENQALRDEMLRLGSSILLYMDIHAYSQMILLPFEGTNRKPDDYDELKAVADAAAAAIYAEDGREFIVGTTPDIMYPVSGGTLDWAKLVAGIRFPYSPELRPSAYESYGFNAPTSDILPSGREMFAGVTAALDKAERIIRTEQCENVNCEDNPGMCFVCHLAEGSGSL